MERKPALAAYTDSKGRSRYAKNDCWERGDAEVHVSPIAYNRSG